MFHSLSAHNHHVMLHFFHKYFILDVIQRTWQTMNMAFVVRRQTVCIESIVLNGVHKVLQLPGCARILFPSRNAISGCQHDLRVVVLNNWEVLDKCALPSVLISAKAVNGIPIFIQVSIR